MIELKYVVPFKVFDFTTEAETSKKLNGDEIQKCLWKNRWFLEDLNDYFGDDKYGVKAILPWHIDHDNAGFYVDFRVYSDAETLSDTDISDITDYIKGQVSDGWGEGGFDLFDGLHLDFDWRNVVHNGFRFVTDKEFEDITDIFKGRQILAIKASDTSKKFLDNPSDDNLLKMVDEAIANLYKLAYHLEKEKEGR